MWYPALCFNEQYYKEVCLCHHTNPNALVLIARSNFVPSIFFDEYSGIYSLEMQVFADGNRNSSAGLIVMLGIGWNPSSIAWQGRAWCPEIHLKKIRKSHGCLRLTNFCLQIMLKLTLSMLASFALGITTFHNLFILTQANLKVSKWSTWGKITWPPTSSN